MKKRRMFVLVLASVAVGYGCGVAGEPFMVKNVALAVWLFHLAVLIMLILSCFGSKAKRRECDMGLSLLGLIELVGAIFVNGEGGCDLRVLLLPATMLVVSGIVLLCLEDS